MEKNVVSVLSEFNLKLRSKLLMKNVMNTFVQIWRIPSVSIGADVSRTLDILLELASVIFSGEYLRGDSPPPTQGSRHGLLV